jgi:hypothetical protein
MGCAASSALRADAAAAQAAPQKLAGAPAEATADAAAWDAVAAPELLRRCSFGDGIFFDALSSFRGAGEACCAAADAPAAAASSARIAPPRFAFARAATPRERAEPVRAANGAFIPLALAAAAAAAPARASSSAAPGAAGAAVTAGVTCAADDTDEFAAQLATMGDDLAAQRAPAARRGGGALGARRTLSTLRSVSRLRHVELSSFTAGPIALYLPFSTVQMLTLYSHAPQRPAPLVRLAWHLRAAALAVTSPPGAGAPPGAPPGALERLLAALRCQLAALDLPPPSLLSPMDAVAGETSRIVRTHRACPKPHRAPALRARPACSCALTRHALRLPPAAAVRAAAACVRRIGGFAPRERYRRHRGVCVGRAGGAHQRVRRLRRRHGRRGARLGECGAALCRAPHPHRHARPAHAAPAVGARGCSVQRMRMQPCCAGAGAGAGAGADVPRGAGRRRRH